MPPASTFGPPAVVIVTPGTSVIRLPITRAVGVLSSTSRVMTWVCATLRTSTIGLEPETVMVSVIAPALNSTLTEAAKPAVSVMPSRRTVEKPCRANVTRIRAGLQIDELIPAIPFGYRGADLFDQHRAACFDRDAGHHPAGRIGHDATDTRALLRHGRRRIPPARTPKPSPDAAKLS